MDGRGKRCHRLFLSCLLSVITGVAAQTCNFDNNNNCDWTLSVVPSSGSFYWSRLNHRSPTPGTGPTTDHTTGTEYRGYYIHTDASFGAQGEQAWLTSPTVESSVDQNFTFWYHMYSSRLNGMGQLQLFLVPVGGALGDDGLLWAKSGNQGDQWTYASVVIPQQSAYKLVFVGTRASSIAGDIALDDIVITDADMSESTLQYDCDFEAPDLCGYVQDETDQLQWTRQQGPTPSTGTGPSADHSLGTSSGHFMYMETSVVDTPLSAGDSARLLSPRYPATTSMCLTFFYHMYGGNIGSLRVYVKQTGTLTLMWSKSRSLGDTWYMAVTPLVTDSEFQVVFEAARGDGSFGDIAIDDVAIVNGSCPVPSVTPAHTTIPTTIPTTVLTTVPTTTASTPPPTITPLAAATTTPPPSFSSLLTSQTSVTATLAPTSGPTSAMTPSTRGSVPVTTDKTLSSSALTPSYTSVANETSVVLGRTDDGIDYLDGIGLVAGVCLAVLFWVVVYAVVVHFIRKRRRKERQDKKSKGHFDVEYDPKFDDVFTNWKGGDDDDSGRGTKSVPDLQDTKYGMDEYVPTPGNGLVATLADVETDKAHIYKNDAQSESGVADVSHDDDPSLNINGNTDITTASTAAQENSNKADDGDPPLTVDSTQDETDVSVGSDSVVQDSPREGRSDNQANFQKMPDSNVGEELDNTEEPNDADSDGLNPVGNASSGSIPRLLSSQDVIFLEPSYVDDVPISII